MSPDFQLEQLLKQHKFKLVSQNKHLKYQNPEGKIFITSKTPSDWRAIKNMLTTLKQVIANRLPSSSVVEEERQRKLVEAEIALVAQRKATVGMSGAGKKAKSNGTGFIYIDRPVQFVTEEQRELDRIATEWVKLKHRLLCRRRELEQQMANVFGFAEMIIFLVYARGMTARLIRDTRKNPDASLPLLRRKNFRMATCLRVFMWLKKMSFERRPGERLFEHYQTGDESVLYDGKPPVLPPDTTADIRDKTGEGFGIHLNPESLKGETSSDMYEAILFLTELFYVSDPAEKPDWLLLPNGAGAMYVRLGECASIAATADKSTKC